MTRNLDSSFHEGKNALTLPNGFVWLYEILIPPSDGYPVGRALRLTNYTRRLSFGSNSSGAALSWRPFPISNGAIRSTQSGDVVGIQVTVGNATGEISEVVDEFRGLIDQPVEVTIVKLTELDVPTAHVRWRARVADCLSKTEAVVFDLRPSRLERAMIPKQRYAARRCRHEFGGSRCGYLIPTSPGETVGTGFSTCGLTFEDCTERGLDEAARGVTNRHPFPRWGGWLGIPRR